MVAALLDISKAFDTIPNAAIRRALKLQKIGTPIINLILNSYATAKTQIEVNNKY